MGKRKQKAPQKATEDKRKCLTWNMMDNAANGDSDLINDQIDVPVPVVHEAMVTANVQINKEQVGTHSNGLPAYRRDDLLDIFNLHIENCLFNFPIQSALNLKQDEWRCTLAEFSLNFSPSPVFVPLPSKNLPDIPQLTLHVSKKGEKNVLCYHVLDPAFTGIKNSKKSGKLKSNIPGDVKFWLVDTDLPVNVLEAFKCKNLLVVVDSFDASNMCIRLKVIGTEAVVSHLAHPSEAVRSTKHVNQALKVVMSHFYGIAEPDYDGLGFTKKHDIDELYRIIKEVHMRDFSHIMQGVQHPDLLPRLRPYQQQAITWMLLKEKLNESYKDPGILHYMLGNKGAHLMHGNIYTCTNCGNSYKTHQGLEKHLCPCCQHGGKIFTRKDRLNQHKCLEKHDCDLCKKTYTSRVRLLNHKCAYCKICNKLFSTVQKKTAHTCVQNSDAVITSTALVSMPFYQPTSPKWQQQMCDTLGFEYTNTLDICTMDVNTPINSLEPTETFNIAGDGNCYFRTLSALITGSELHHLEIRQLLVLHMITIGDNLARFMNTPMNIAKYLFSTRMSQSGAWATQVELFAAAHWLKTCINLYTKTGSTWKWLQYSPACVERDINISTMGIYIHHVNQNHFEPVVAMVNPTVTIPHADADWFTRYLNKKRYINKLMSTRKYRRTRKKKGVRVKK